MNNKNDKAQNNTQNHKKDFPLLNKKYKKNREENEKNNSSIVYLDNAATTQKPYEVIQSIKEYYENTNANAHRGVYEISERATKLLEESREEFAKFINAKSNEIIFTRNATEGFNQLANSLEKTIKPTKKDNIVVTEIEHHSNFLPWQQLCKRTYAEFRIVKYDPKTHELGDISKYVDSNTIIVAFTLMSNVSGLMVDSKKIISEIRKKNPKTLIILDATQYVAHNILDVKNIDADFICFSAHKMYGPTGVGIVFGKEKLLSKMEPFFYGGNMISRVGLYESSWAEAPERFEAGTIDVAGIVASSVAIRYLHNKRFSELIRYEDELKKYLLKELRKFDYIKIIGHNNTDNNKNRYNNSNYGPVVSFVVKNIHPHDLATICDRYNVCIRAGHHCAQPFMQAINETATARASISFYNTREDIDRLIMAIKDAHRILVK